MTSERWLHIVENHDEMAGYYDDVLLVVESPDTVLRGYRGSLIAVRGYGRKRYLTVMELSREDGFVITAYFSSDFDGRETVWKRQ